MFVPLTTQDFLARGATVYPDRVAVVDEPDQPAGSVGALTFAAARRARATRSPPGSTRSASRPASGSPSSARTRPAMLDLFYGATAIGAHRRADQLPPQAPTRSPTSSSTAARRCCSSTPSSTTPLAGVRAPHRFVLGAETDAALLRFGVEPRPWTGADEDATATINYTSGTTARPKGVRADAPQHLAQRDDDGAAPRRHRSRRLPAHACRCSTPTAGACRSRSPRSACRRSCCARSTAPRSCAASSATA